MFITLDINECMSFLLSLKIRHYCNHALSFIMAFPTENPVLTANFQFILGRTRGSDYAVESLRAALLGVAAIHQSFLLSRSGVSDRVDEVMNIAGAYRNKSRQLLARACSTPEGTQSDASLGAVAAISLIDVSARYSTLCWSEDVS